MRNEIKTLLFISAVILFLLPVRESAAYLKIDTPKHEFAFGPSASYLYMDGHGYSVNLDLSYTYDIFSASINLKQIEVEDYLNYGAQCELSIWFFLNFGGGVGYLFGKKHSPIYHVFLGAPIPIADLHDALDPFALIYIEPYYRLNFFRKDLIHEVGIMLKITTYKF